MVSVASDLEAQFPVELPSHHRSASYLEKDINMPVKEMVNDSPKNPYMQPNGY